MWENIHLEVANYYSKTFASHGVSPRGVDWADGNGQQRRIQTLMKVLPTGGEKLTVLDFGCGYGQLASMLGESGYRFSYTGVDLVPSLIAAGRSRFAAVDNVTFVSELSPDASFDYVFASGVFNVKLETSSVVWESYVRETIEDLASRAGRGLALNFLGSPSSPGLAQDHLHYQEPAMVRATVRNLGFKKVTELREPPWEFAVLAWK